MNSRKLSKPTGLFGVMSIAAFGSNSPISGLPCQIVPTLAKAVLPMTLPLWNVAYAT